MKNEVKDRMIEVEQAKKELDNLRKLLKRYFKLRKQLGFPNDLNKAIAEIRDMIERLQKMHETVEFEQTKMKKTQLS